MKNQALRAYNSWPIRLYLIRNGKVIFTGAQGPFGYQPAALEKAIKRASLWHPLDAQPHRSHPEPMIRRMSKGLR